MKNVIIGTAGHVDHGKTSLIQALTGTNPDRLKEEQQRGMTIDIGFAALKLPDGTTAGIVDVPGHERFLKNMLAGANGVDVVLLVIAADESVMPQTREHLDILRLLDVRNGVIALTKCDLVDKEWTDEVENDVRERVKDTFLSNSPIISVSSVTGKGIDALKKALLSAVSRAEARNASLPFRLPIDRVFTRPGFGTVVTGTLTAGTLRVGDAVEILPERLPSRVRGLQVHNQKVTECGAGSRVAVNIAGVDHDAITRGSTLIAPGLAEPAELFDAALRILPETPLELKDRDRIRLHIGTAELLGRVRILDERTTLTAGSTAYIQFRSEKPVACLRGDRFVVRSYSPIHTMGGGIVLDVSPPRHRKGAAATLASLAAKEHGTPNDLIETMLQRLPYGSPWKDVLNRSGLTPDQFQTALNELISTDRATQLPAERVILSPTLAGLTDRMKTALSAYHDRFPLRPGYPKEELRAALGRDLDQRAFTPLLSYWVNVGLIIQETTAIRLADFTVTLSERQKALLTRIEDYYRDCGIAIPPLSDVVQAVQAPPDAVSALLRVGLERGLFHRVADDQYYHADTITRLQDLVRGYLQDHSVLTVATFRDLVRSNRRFSLTLLEYFDQIRFTKRLGDDRVLA